MITNRIHTPATLKSIALAAVMAATWLGATSAGAQQAGAPAGAEVGDLITVSAEVVAIDKSSREVTLRGPQGNEMTLELGEEVKNFDQIKVGDSVKAGYYESIAISKGVSGTPEIVDEQSLDTAAKGEKPGMVATDAVQISVTVIGIDSETRLVTLRRDDGSLIKRKVDPSVAAFDELKIGDVIQVTVTRALAVMVEPQQQ